MADRRRRRTAAPIDRGLWTIPNLISLLRLLASRGSSGSCSREDRPIAAGILLAVLGATDWVDGYIARHFDQGSEIGKILDPVADRVMLIAGAVGAADRRRRADLGRCRGPGPGGGGERGDLWLAAAAPAGSMCNGSEKRARWR